jgi:hypothetical protein
MQAPLGTRITCLPNITFNGHPAFAGPAVTFPLYDFLQRCRLLRKALAEANSDLLSGLFCQSTAASRCVQRAISQKDGGDGRDRTDDLMLAKQLLSQLSYVP